MTDTEKLAKRISDIADELIHYPCMTRDIVENYMEIIKRICEKELKK